MTLLLLSSGLEGKNSHDSIMTVKVQLLTIASISATLGGAKILCTMNLCLLFSLGS
uniref:Uncharacterized protein n=1 Tax=Salmo trutta TaxID=8032 RepID=A0A674C317_SALTR